MLIHFGVKPYLVFDGNRLPSKSQTEAARQERRTEAKKEGMELLKAGKQALAHKTLQKAIDVTPQMTHALIQELKKINVPYIVAPYEADAQLAYLEKKGIINGVLSEDSDLLVFGVQRLLTKLDQYGNCIEVNRNEFSACRDISLIGWTDADFRTMAILSGCDYLGSLPNMGLKTAYRFVRRYKAIDKILKMLQLDGTLVPQDYAARFEQAQRSFFHHRVFCPITKQLVLLNDLPDSLTEEEMPYLGAKDDSETAILVAFGDLDPMTKEPISKESHLVPSMTPGPTKASMFNENRRRTLGTTEELKDNKKINTFFKKRTPLAELDPNSLTPSPSQQRLLQRHSNASWVGRSCPSPMVQASRSLSQSRTSPSGIEEFLIRAAEVSDYQSPKRQRLCSEADDSVTTNGSVASPFFAKTKVGSSKTKGAVKKSRRSDFGIFSDDSIDDVLNQFLDTENGEGGVSQSFTEETSDVETQMGKEKEMSQPGNAVVNSALSVNDDMDNLEEDVDFVPTSSPPTTNVEFRGASYAPVSSTVSTSQATNLISQSTTPTSIGPDDDSFVDLLELHVQNQNASLAQRYSYQSPAEDRLVRSKGGGKKSTTLSADRDGRVSLEKLFSADSIVQTTADKIQSGPAAITVSTREHVSHSTTPLQELSQSA